MNGLVDLGGPVFSPASPQADALLHVFVLVLIVCAVIFAIVAGLICFSLVRFRSRPGAGEPRQVFGQARLEVFWTVVPLLIVIWLSFLTLRGMRLSDPVATGEPDLVVIGHQWWWEARYPASGVVTANEIHIPVNEKLLVRLEAADVIHNFWIPALGRKLDMIPGRPNHLWLEADRTGVFDGVCSEYCGAQHAWMRFVVVAEARDAFDAWLRAQAMPAAIPTTNSGQRGLELFKEQTCITCHAIRGVSVTGNAAPDLTHLASRGLIGAGVLANTDVNLARWLKDPQAVKPASRMPNLNLTDTQVDELVSYLGRGI